MRPYRGARSLRAVRSLLPAFLALVASAGALAQTALVTTTHTVVGQGDPPAVEHSFTIANAGTYSVTLTDLGSKQSPAAPLSYVAMSVTEGGALVGSPSSVTAPGTPIKITATANSTYIVHVVGLPGNVLGGSGPIEVDVADSSGNAVPGDSWGDTLSAPSSQANGVGFLNDSFTMSAASGTYTVAIADLQFPTAVTNPYLLLVDATSGAQVARLSPSSLSASVTLNQGDSYQVIAFAVEATNAAGGLFSVSIGASGSTVYGPKIVPVGGVTLLQTSASGSPQSSFSLAAGSATLTLDNLPFPTVTLPSVGAVVVDVATAQPFPAGSPPGVALNGSQTFTAPSASDPYEVFAYGTADSTAQWGSYAVLVQQGTAFPFSEAEAVASPGSTIQPFNLDATVPSAGSYSLTLMDFKFPTVLEAAALAAVQDGRIVNSINAAGSVSTTLSQGPVTLLAFGQEGSSNSASSPGLMGIDLSPAGGGSAVFDATEGIGAGFSSTSFTVPSAQTVQVNVADLDFPVGLANLNLIVTSGISTPPLEIASAGSSASPQFKASANTAYNVNVLATPAAASNSQPEAAGTYAMSVDPTPVVTLTPSSTSVTSGGTVTLTWSAQNVTSCTASASPANSAWSGNESTSGGPVTTSAITADTTFSLN